MKAKSEILLDKEQTAGEMYRLIEQYYNDLDKIYIIKNGVKIPLSSIPLKAFFDMTRKIPYKKDFKNIEVVQRPKYTLMTGPTLGADCKKKSILISSYLKSNGIPYRLIGSSKYPNGRIHHVFPQGKIKGQWRNLDATYSHYKMFEPKKITRAVIL